MVSKKPAFLVYALLSLILLNFLAQVPYYFHLYYRPGDVAPYLRSFAIMGAVFAWFLAAVLLYLRGRRAGFWLLAAFLTVEFGFYFYGAVSSVIHGLGLFFQVRNPDPILRIIYSIGYVNLFASGALLVLILTQRGLYQGD